MCAAKKVKVCAPTEYCLSVSISVGAWCRLPIAGCQVVCCATVSSRRSHNSRIIISRQPRQTQAKADVDDVWRFTSCLAKLAEAWACIRLIARALFLLCAALRVGAT